MGKATPTKGQNALTAFFKPQPSPRQSPDKPTVAKSSQPAKSKPKSPQKSAPAVDVAMVDESKPVEAPTKGKNKENAPKKKKEKEEKVVAPPPPEVSEPIELLCGETCPPTVSI